MRSLLTLTQEKLSYLLWASVPLLLFFIAYHQAAEAWWMQDDPQLLKMVVAHSPWEYFFKPTVWRVFSSTNLTPWSLLSFEIDWQLFGFNPHGFYIHHLISFAIALIAIYAAITPIWGSPVAGLTTIFFLNSSAAASAVQLLMVRNYVEGLALAALSFWCYLQAVRKRRMSLAFAGALLYLFSVTAKEIYVPLAALLPLLPLGTSRLRWKSALPYMGVVPVYIMWRLWMLGTNHLLSGYGHHPGWSTVFHFPYEAIILMGWTTPWQQSILVVNSALFLWFVLTRPRTRLTVSLCLIAILVLPLVPVISILSYRYLMLPMLFVSLALALGLFHLWQQASRPYMKALSLISGIALLTASCTARDTNPWWQNRQGVCRYRAEGQFLMAGPPDAVLVEPFGPGWYYEGLFWLRRRLMQETRGPQICGDRCLCHHPGASSGRWWTYADGVVRPVAHNNQGCELRPDAPLSVKFLYADGAIRWHFGPYRAGKYAVMALLDEGTLRQDALPGPPLLLPREGSCCVTLYKPTSFWVRYQSPAGWTTCSPLLSLDATEGSLLEWYRPMEGVPESKSYQ